MKDFLISALGAALLLAVPTHCMSAQVATKVAAPPMHFNFNQSSGLYADGRWVSSKDGKASFPSETQINCDRQGMTCVAATAEYYYGHPHVSIEYLQILSIDVNGLIAATDDGICMRRTMVVSPENKSITVTGTLKKLTKDVSEACAAFGAKDTYTETFVLKNSPEWMKNPYGENDGK